MFIRPISEEEREREEGYIERDSKRKGQKENYNREKEKKE